MIDHTALLLRGLVADPGCDDEDSEIDDEHEWNATFLLDELEQQQQQQHQQEEKKILLGVVNVAEANDMQEVNDSEKDNGEYDNTDFDLISVTLEDTIPVVQTSCRKTQNKKPQRPLALSRCTTMNTNHLTTHPSSFFHVEKQNN